MICETCHGTGKIGPFPIAIPCPICGGCGVAHCCDGLVEQPAEEDDADAED